MIRAIVLAAGKGTRMKSARPKVLHLICGRPMLWWSLRALAEAGVDEIAIVINGEIAAKDVLEMAADAGAGRASAVVQEPQLGTGHAASIALAALEPASGTVVVLSGDMPLIEGDLIKRTVAARTGALALVTARMPLPSNFGRIVRANGRVEKIVEARDATPDELALDEMNAALYAFDEAKLRAALAELTTDNAQGEYYLTDTVAALCARGERVDGVEAPDYRAVLGVNDRVELARAGRHLNRRLCEHYMRGGVTIVDPESTYLEPGLRFGTDVTILPNTTLGRGTAIGSHSEIGPNARLREATVGVHVTIADSVVVESEIGDFATVGPFAHLRGSSVLGTGVRIGNFVETKNAKLAAGVRAGHLAYLGDAVIGKNTNVGAGTITCNYDGEHKHQTTIGDGVFIGSNSSLVAPLTIGDAALTGAGSVVTKDVPAGERVAGNPARALPKKAAH
jgi:bifunctional UDP-N-acetylglucosamine pyrophosphorylase/glucosamine-1-phosphate N-acetyltransferase